MSRFPERTTILIGVFIACCLLSSIRVVLNTPFPSKLNVDDVESRSDQRFAALKSALAEQRVVGYVGESDEHAPEGYLLAQYALAPLVIDRSIDHALVVGNFPTSPDLAPYPKNLRLVKDFGHGVLLLANKDAK